MAFFEFPHTRTYDSDLGWLIEHVKENSTDIDTLETQTGDQETRLQAVETAEAADRAEIVNARNGALGVNYNSLGNAIRGQVQALYNIIDGLVLDVNGDTNSKALWEQGGLFVASGLNTPSTLRLRTISYVPRNVARVEIGSGYKMSIYAYDRANSEAYVGIWNGSTWQTNTQYWFASGSTVDLSGFMWGDDYDIRILIANNAESTITTAAYNHIKFYSRTDTSLTMVGMPADAYATGKRFVNIRPEDFGAAGDGATDDTQAWQDCIDYAAANHLAIKCDGGKTYLVKTLTVVNWRNIDFNYCTLKAAPNTSTPPNQRPILLVDNDNVPHDMTGNDPVNAWHGMIRNVILDGNNNTRLAFKIARDWRGCYENFYTINVYPGPSNSQLGVHYQIMNANGSLFRNFRAQGQNQDYEQFMDMQSSDVVIENCDFQGIRYGIYNKGTAQYNLIHGYVANDAIWPDSYFMRLREPCIAQNLYPDTQQYLFMLDRNNDYHLSGIEIAYNWNQITYPPVSPSYIFYDTTGDASGVTNARIVNGMFRLNANAANAYDVCNESGLPLYACTFRNITTYPVVV